MIKPCARSSYSFGIRTCNSKMLLDALYPSDQVREQLALRRNSPLGGDRLKIASKVLRRDPR